MVREIVDQASDCCIDCTLSGQIGFNFVGDSARSAALNSTARQKRDCHNREQRKNDNGYD